MYIMEKPIIYLGSDYIYNNKSCDYFYKLEIKKCLKSLEEEIKKLKIKVIRPKKLDIKNLCMALWVRDTSINIKNKLYIIPQMLSTSINSDISSSNRSFQVSQEVSVIPYKNESEIIPSSVNLDGGDILIDNRNIFLGKGIRTDKTAELYLKKICPNYRIISVKHHALHLDCCMGILPNKKLLYSKKYIKKLPSFLRKEYDCYCVENYINKDSDSNLATNFLLIGKTIIIVYQKKFEKIYKLIESFNIKVITIPFSNVSKGGGGIRCMTQWYKLPKEQLIY